MTRAPELLKGSARTLILSLLRERAMYGYLLSRTIEERTGGKFRLKEGTLYPILHALEAEGFVEGRWAEAPTGRRRKYYHLTGRGTRHYELKAAEWAAFSGAVNAVLHH